MALLFLKAWGWEVTAFSTNPKKEPEIRKLGVHHFLISNNASELENISNILDLILVTSNVDLNWDTYINALNPGGKLHIVGAVDKINATVFPLISHQRSLGGSPTGGPGVIKKMLKFCERNEIKPVAEEFKLSEVNEALNHLEKGKARYRIV